MFWRKKNNDPEKLSTNEGVGQRYFNKLQQDSRIKDLMAQSLESIQWLFIVLDTDENRQLIKGYLQNRDTRRILKIANNLPFDFDEADYPTITIFRLENKNGIYFIITRENEIIETLR